MAMPVQRGSVAAAAARANDRRGKKRQRRINDKGLKRCCLHEKNRENPGPVKRGKNVPVEWSWVNNTGVRDFVGAGCIYRRVIIEIAVGAN